MTKLEAILLSIFLYPLLLLFIWGIVAFASLEPNMLQWTLDGRSGFIMAYLMFGAIGQAAIIFGYTKSRDS